MRYRRVFGRQSGAENHAPYLVVNATKPGCGLTYISHSFAKASFNRTNKTSFHACPAFFS